MEDRFQSWINAAGEYTVAQLSEGERLAASAQRSPYGEKLIRREIRSGRLRARRVGNRDLVCGADYLSWKNALPLAPTEPSVADSVRRSVAAEIRREQAAVP